MGREPVNSTFFLYNTVCSITIYDTDPHVDEILEGAKRNAFQIQRMLDFYDPDSELGRMNRKHKTGVPYQVSRELYLFLAELLKFSSFSEGCFDPAIGPLVRLWNITAANPKAPSEHEIEIARSKTGAEYIICGPDNNTITFKKHGMVLDAGGAGKGYAAGCVAEHLKSHGIRSASINFGGNLYLIGAKMSSGETTRPWKIGIQAPWRSDLQTIGSLTLQDCGIATSGGYDRYFGEKGNIYHHLLDPRSGYPADHTLDSVTIVSENALYTDLLSTACFVGGEELAEKVCSRTGAGYVFVRKDGSIIVSDNLKQHFKQNRIEKGMG